MKKPMKNDIEITNENNGKQLFELLGDLDESMVEDAWLDHGEEVIIMEEKSPFRFVKAAAGIAAAIAIIGGGIYGFNKFRNSLGFSPAASISEGEVSEELSEPEPEVSEPYSKISAPEISEPQVIEPIDEPTVFEGFDGDEIMSSDVTRTSTGIKPSEITWAENSDTIAYCDGFCYFREPAGIAFDSYNNPELFTYTGNPDKKDSNSFYGDMPENRNEYKRLYEGDEICGLKLKKATTQFKLISSPFPGEIEICPEYETFVEFEGEIVIKGILCVTAPNLSNDGGNFRFYPTEDKLPVLGTTYTKIADEYRIAYAHETCAVHIVNEYPYIDISKTFANYDHIDGVDKGDAVYARVILSDIAYDCYNGVVANLAGVEILSEPIAHVDEWMQK